MKPRRGPSLEGRRTRQFESELVERARTWLPSWSLEDGNRDFGRALLEVAAMFSAEVAERFDASGDKMRRGLLDWLAITREAARPARLPVVFKMADTLQDTVLATAPVQMQVDVGPDSVVLETEDDLTLLPGAIQAVYAVDADADTYYSAPPGFTSLDPVDPVPTEWRVRTFAAGGGNKLQLDSKLGLKEGLVISIAGAEYLLEKIEEDIVTVDPPLAAGGIAASSVVQRVDTFAPFDKGARNLQFHALYLGHTDLLNIEAAASIHILGNKTLERDAQWDYWGKRDGVDAVGWQRLDPDPAGAQSTYIMLAKPKGSVEPRKIGNIDSSRWLRASMPRVVAKRPELDVDELSLRVNCDPLGPPCPTQTKGQTGPAVEAMANTTPLVLSDAFYPLGREPKQFDAFYLGSAEALSKKGATAYMCFEMGDATCAAYAVLRFGPFAGRVLAGVGRDGALYLFYIDPASGSLRRIPDRGPLRPPTFDANGQKGDGGPSIALNSRCRPVIWRPDPGKDDVNISVAAGGTVYTWRELAGNAVGSGWRQDSVVPSLPSGSAMIEDLVVLPPEQNGPAVALSEGFLRRYNGSTWSPPVGADKYVCVVPIRDPDGNLIPAVTDVITVNTAGALFRLGAIGAPVAIAPGTSVDIGDVQNGILPWAGATRPAVVLNGDLYIVSVSRDRTSFMAVKNGAPGVATALKGTATGPGVDVLKLPTGDLQFSISASKAGGKAVLKSLIGLKDTLESEVDGAAGSSLGAPVTSGGYVVIPGDGSNAYLASFDPLQRRTFTVGAAGAPDVITEAGLIVPNAFSYAAGDFISVMDDVNTRRDIPIPMERYTKASDTLFPLTVAQANIAQPDDLLAYRAATQAAAQVFGGTGKQMKLTSPNPRVHKDDFLRIRVDANGNVGFYKVTDIAADNVTVTLQTAWPAAVAAPAALTYWTPEAPATYRIVPLVRFDAGNGNWDAHLLDRAKFQFPSSVDPQTQAGTAFQTSGTRPAIVALDARWTPTKQPQANDKFILDGALGSWSQQLANTTSNPALSWEYWNGTSWWSLPVISDATQRLATTGQIKFTVPEDIAESDWSGKKNFWIRARLVGGDYGHEDVKVVSKPLSNGTTEQTVVRSSDNIKAPLVLALHMSYSMCKPVLPQYVLTQDSGAISDQSDANRTPIARVQAFVPLAVTLGRLNATSSASATDPGCPPSCACGPAGQSAGASVGSTGTPSAFAPATGRALLLGFDKALSGANARVLVSVRQESEFDKAAPMQTAVAIGGRFVPVVSSDESRAASETGIVTLAFDTTSTAEALFGGAFHWLRFQPGPGGDDGWAPKLRGVYANAVRASATETLTRELLGSSEGAPNLVVKVARPPVLRDSLELRVREPLGDEDRQALLDADEKKVLTIDDPPGDWVLWTQVADPLDEPPSSRVYALDERTGEIRFGDELHGRIPPVGRDSIVAFRYARTEARPDGDTDVPANRIQARAPISLVSPVTSVDAVFAADQAAGGAPPEPDDRVLQFAAAKLRHRERAVTARDFEDIVLETFPDIAQARMLLDNARARLVVVTQAGEGPNRAQARALRAALLERAPAALASASFEIAQPRIRRVRVDLALRVRTLDVAGDLAGRAKNAVKAFFDVATGGPSGEGFAIGATPRAEDLARAIVDLPDLDGIASIALLETIAGDEKPWSGVVKAAEIVRLADDGVRVAFDLVGAVA